MHNDARCRREVGADDLGALSCVAESNGTPYAGGRARDEGHLIRKARSSCHYLFKHEDLGAEERVDQD